ncbi:hypothetical protein GNI_100790 [Gregarina niphandrodes]|uniref:Uncharacterized protein n=1 Tax=Gregarina niphandrodes TaxID=110365 RepID=A0A023B4K9_GRENI|nr:hypothetical protein GNI_100790 [Gregarina niphandrodes]EZG56820.1 hypothetical protein GNI_100790 [Gregarina niphandrodes]|eukprot:XP_011131142.1 hypothetical protein GNI_100790 [Gregarina niphandrodes]
MDDPVFARVKTEPLPDDPIAYTNTPVQQEEVPSKPLSTLLKSPADDAQASDTSKPFYEDGNWYMYLVHDGGILKLPGNIVAGTRRKNRQILVFRPPRQPVKKYCLCEYCNNLGLTGRLTPSPPLPVGLPSP